MTDLALHQDREFTSPAPEATIQIIRREWVDGRITVILVREPVGI